MTTKASIRQGYRIRLGLIGLLLIGFGGWFLYDGLVGYPNHNEHVRASQAALEQFKTDHPDTWRTGWTAHARAQGYAEDPASLNSKSDWDIYTQLIITGITMPAGLLFVGVYFAAGRRWVATEPDGLRSSAGLFAPWDAITTLDKSRWKTKGIAVVHFTDQGGEKRIVLDDWKFETDPTVAILAEVQARTGLGDEDDASTDDPASDDASTDADAQPDIDAQSRPASSTTV